MTTAARRHEDLAVRVAKLYYYQRLTTEQIAEELNTSRSTVSRLLSWAHEHGLVEIHVHDPAEQPGQLEAQLRERFGVRIVRVVHVPASSRESDWLERVVADAAGYLNSVIGDDCIVGVAWGTTVGRMSERLKPKPTKNVDFVALNGAGTPQSIDSTIGTDLVLRFAANYGARAHAFPVPAFFDHPETKTALWRERSVRRLLDLQQRADVLVFSVGAFASEVPSQVHAGGFLEAADRRDLRRDRVVGDIATVFFRADGSWRDVALNARASGPDLELFRSRQSICVVSGTGKAEGIRAALAGGFVHTLIVDEPTARLVLEGAPSRSARRTPAAGGARARAA
ncbi:MAG TPA: sugar-binding domain-containing protein [Zeimonas sp.]|nr:sugar-binding domain-containing protein [Zeimonas sp.]